MNNLSLKKRTPYIMKLFVAILEAGLLSVQGSIPARQGKFFLLVTTFRQSVEPTQPYIQWALLFLFILGIKRPGREADT
jgi:hypothetical protein